MDENYVGKRIKQIRLGKGLSRNDVVKNCRISASFLSEVERGVKPNPTIEKLLEVAKGLKVSVTDIITEKDLVRENIKIIKGNKSSKDFSQELNDFIGEEVFNSHTLDSYLAGEIDFSEITIGIIAEYAQIDNDVIYKANDDTSLALARRSYINENEGEYNAHSHDEYKDIIDKIEENNIPVEDVMSLLDILIKQKE